MPAHQGKELPGIQKPIDLLCEYAVNPIGIDSVCPRFSWVLRHSARASIQSAYRILVASTPENLFSDKGDIWDSKKVKSDKSVNVEYHGKPLESKTRYYWKLKWWDDDGKASPLVTLLLSRWVCCLKKIGRSLDRRW